MRKILFAHPEMHDLAQEILKHSNVVSLGEIDWKYFEDGYPNIFIRNVADVRGSDVTFLATLESSALIFEQLAVVRALPRYGAGALRLIVPYFPGTMDRVDCEGQIATAKSLARDLSTIPFSRGGPAEVVTYDIHALQERFYFEDSVIPRLETAIPLLHDRLGMLPDCKNVVIAFPDEGAKKRFGKKFEAFSQIICTKVRDGDRRNVTIKEGDPNGKHIVIVDDMTKTGRTLLNCYTVLRNAGASAVSAYVTHGVFADESWRWFTYGTFRHVWLTDACPRTVKMVRGKQPFEVLSLAPLLANIIRA